MGICKAFEQFAAFVAAASSPADLAEVLGEVTTRMGYDFYALTHHVDPRRGLPSTIRVHNYPPRWVDYFDRNDLSARDPIHRASQRTAFCFAWQHVPQMIPLTRQDRNILALAADHGIGEGVTIPANVPGEAHGSCSFATLAGRPLPGRSFALAQLAGGFAFEGARRICGLRPADGATPAPVLTDRQRDCLVWAARGKSDWETSRILEISEETVAQHVSQACDRYGVHKRTSLIIHALVDGTISFAEIVQR